MQSGAGRAALRVCALTSNDFRPGVCIELEGAPWKVVGARPVPCCYAASKSSCCLDIHPQQCTAAPSKQAVLPPASYRAQFLSPVAVAAEFLHVKPGKGAAFVRTKLKNFITGNVVDKTFRGGESVDAATVEKKETQFSYVDGDDVRFCCCCAVGSLSHQLQPQH